LDGLDFLARAFVNPLARADKVVGSNSPGVSLDLPKEELPLMLKDIHYNKKNN
jgi:hypothetical protein